MTTLNIQVSGPLGGFLQGMDSGRAVDAWGKEGGQLGEVGGNQGIRIRLA